MNFQKDNNLWQSNQNNIQNEKYGNINPDNINNQGYTSQNYSNNNNNKNYEFSNYYTKNDSHKVRPKSGLKFKKEVEEKRIKNNIENIVNEQSEEKNNLEDLYSDEKNRRLKLIDNTSISEKVIEYFNLNSQKSVNTLKVLKAKSIKYNVSHEEISKINSLKNFAESKQNLYNSDIYQDFISLLEKPFIAAGDFIFYFPNNCALRINIKLNKTVNELYNWVKKYLNNPNDYFQIYFRNNIFLNDFDKLLFDCDFQFPEILMINFPIGFSNINFDLLSDTQSRTIN